MSKINVEVDCTKRCKSRNHGQALSSAITKRSVTDESLASFIKATCANFSKAFDFEVSNQQCINNLFLLYLLV